MPDIQIHLFKRTLAQKRALARAVTDAVTQTLKIPAKRVNIILTDMREDDRAIGGTLISDLEKKTKKKSKG